MRILPLLCSTLCFAALAVGQDLRRGLVEADAVVVGRQVGKKPHGDDIVLHRVQVLADVRGAAGNAAVTVVDWPQLSLHNRPSPRQSRLYCLQDASAIATRLALPANDGPYFKMVGWAGSHPLIGADPDKDPLVRFARVLASSETGTSPNETVGQLVTMALQPSPVVRREAVRFLIERGDLRSKISSVHWNLLMARATGEVEDVAYKIALAELCAEQRLDGLLDALALSLGPVTDPEYARCVGRIGRLLHGEEATGMLTGRLRVVAREQDRKMLLLAMGATNTTSALEALLRMSTKDAAVTAALKEHRSQQAKDAVLRRK